jgi:hypothetical protein
MLEDERQIRSVLNSRSRFTGSSAHIDSGVAQSCDPLPCHPRKGIDHCRYDSSDAGANHRIGARWSFARVTARFESDIERRTAGQVGGMIESNDFGMRTAVLNVPPFSDNDPGPNNYRSDEGVGFDEAATAFGQLEGAIEELFVVAHGDG